MNRNNSCKISPFCLTTNAVLSSLKNPTFLSPFVKSAAFISATDMNKKTYSLIRVFFLHNKCYVWLRLECSFPFTSYCRVYPQWKKQWSRGVVFEPFIPEKWIAPHGDLWSSYATVSHARILSTHTHTHGLRTRTRMETPYLKFWMYFNGTWKTIEFP